MSKQKRKLKKNQVQVDGNVYNIGSPTYNQMYEDKFENSDVVWDNLLEEWVSVPKGMNDAWDELYKNQRVGKAQDKVRKGTGSFARPILDTGLEMSGAAGTYRFAQDPLKNLQGTYNVLSNFSTPGLAMNAINYIQGKPVFNISEEDLQGFGNTFDVAGLATLGTAPLIKQGLKVAPRLLSSASKELNQGTKTLARELIKNRIPESFGTVNQAGFSDLFGLLKKPKTTPKQAFQSEIDWAKWNPETPNYPELINEYNAIEEATKKSGTWMKNPDGSPFQGTPEQFIQQQSSHFKKAFGNSKLVNPDGSPTIQYHGSAKKFDEFDESKFQLGDAGYSGAGIYTTPSKNLANSYATSSAKFHTGKIEPTVYELYGQANNPISSSELIKQNANTDLFNFHRKRNWKGELTPEESLMQYDAAIADQLPGVENIRAWHDAREIVFPTNKQLKSAIGNVGFFDMTNPNIYKGLVPAAIATGAIGSELMSQEESAPEQKAYGGKITNMKKKKSNNLPQMFWGGKLAPQLFDLAANTLINGTTYAVTDMIKAIREPEQEMRPTKMNTGMVMQTGGVVNNDPKKKKKIKFKKKEYDTDSPEYRKLYESGLVSVDADGLPIVYQGSDEAWNEQFEKQRKKKGENAVRKGTGKFVKETARVLPANPNEPDSFLENAIEMTPTPLGRILSADDMLLAGHDLATENKQGYLRNTLDLASPFLKVGTNPVNPQAFSQVANYYKQLKGRSQPILDALPFVANQIPNIVNYGIPIGGFVDDVYQDNIAPMLPSKNKKSAPQNTNFATGEEEFAMGGMIKRADGSYSKRGLWDNIRANKGSGKKPTKQMLEQEKKIRAQMDNGGTVNPTLPFQQRLNQYLKQPGFNPNIMGMSTGRNNVGLGLRGGPLRQMTSLTNDRKLNPADNFTFNTDNSNPKFNLNTKLGYQDRFGFKGGVDYTSAIGENNPDTKFNVGFDKYGITGDYNYNLNKENPNFNYGVGYKGFGFDTDFRATKEKDKLYNFDAKLGYDRGNTSGNFEFTGNRDDYNLGGSFRKGGIGANFKYANKKNDFKSNAPGFKNFKADAPDNNSNFNVGLLDYDKDGITAKYAISKDNQNPLVHNAKVGYNRKGLDANLSFMGNKLDPNYNFNLNFVPEKGGFTTNANLDFKNNNIDATTGLGYKGKKFNAGVNYKSRINTEEETARQSVNARAGYKGKNFNAGVEYDRQFATDENPAVNRAGLNLGYNKNGFNVNTGVKYKTLSEADKEKEKASPFEVTAGVTYNPNYKQPKQKTTPWKLPKELIKKNEVIRMIDENQLTPQQRMLNEFKSQFTPINLGKRAFGGMITPDMYMQQLMYGSYANGGQVPQNIPVEVEGGEAYELPNGQMGEFEGPSHDNGGIPVALPEQTKVYSKQLKVNGKTMADRKTKREANVAKLEKILSKNPSDKFIKEALKRQQETAALEEQQDMAMQEQANQQQQMQEQAQQGMMQEQAMAGLMQDPAMMQQMGMMMYGGTLNKLANGGEPEPIPPYSLTNPFISNYIAPQTGAYPQMTDANYAQMLEEKDYEHPLKYLPPSDKNLSHDMYSGYGKYPEYVYRNTYDNDLKNMQWSYFNPKEKKSNWTIIPNTDSLWNELEKESNKKESDNLKYISRQYGNNEHDYHLFGSPLIFPKITPEPANISRLQATGINDVMSLNPNEKYLGNEDGFSVIGGKDDEMLFKNTNPNSSMTGTNPYDAMNSVLGNTFGSLAVSKDPYINTKGGMIPNPLYNEVISNKMLREEKGKKPNKFMNFLNEAADKTGDFFSGLFDKNGKPKKEKGTKKEGTKKDEKGLPLTAGDYMGMAGTMFGGLAPMTTTMLNRMMTPKNQNFFREYGAEGLRAMQEAQALSGINRDKQLADIKLGEEASRQRGRNSARGVNTLRAMDISSDIAANQAQNQAYNSYAQQMMQLLGQKGQMENQQDQMVMQGEYQRDLADRQDVDQFYTNLAENFASQSELMQKQGRDMNQAQYNKMILQMSPMFSRYGIGMEMKNGEYVMTHNGETIDQTKARLIVEKGIKAEKKAAVEATKKEEKKEGTTTTTPVNSNVLPAINPLGLGHTPYFNPIFTDINIPTVTDKSLTKAATKRRK